MLRSCYHHATASSAANHFICSVLVCGFEPWTLGYIKCCSVSHSSTEMLPVDFPGNLSVISTHNHTAIQGCPLCYIELVWNQLSRPSLIDLNGFLKHLLLTNHRLTKPILIFCLIFSVGPIISPILLRKLQNIMKN